MPDRQLAKPCPYCARQQSGMYNMRCASCRARLVTSARPSRAMQERMLAYIEKCWGAQAKNETLDVLREDQGE